MGKRRKKEKRSPAEDPHGWLVDHLRGSEQHSVKVQRAVTALSGYDYIVGTDQGAGTSRPFDHKAPDDAIRIDTKSQQHGVLDVKREKPGKQFTAWAASGKQFIPVQLVLDGKTNSWYLVPGIPTRTLGLDPLATAFDPAEPLEPFKIADGCLDDLLDVSVFMSLKEKVQEALSCLLWAKEIIMKAVDAEYLVYLRSAAEDVADNPELMQAIAANDDAMRAIAANDDAMRKLLGPEMFEVWKKTRRS